MVTFTLPAELRQACRAHPAELYNLIIKHSAAALRDVIATKTKGGVAGFTSVLHTWGRQLQHHPHVHLIVPALAWHPHKKQLLRPGKDQFLVHFRPLAARFRTLLREALQNDHPDIYNALPPEAKAVFHPKKTWNVQLQHVGQGKTALRYLARYVKRSAIGPKRLIGYDKQGNIQLHWTSSQTKRPGILTLTIVEFIRRWLLHILPKGFARVRHYGFMSSAAIKTRQAIRPTPAPTAAATSPSCANSPPSTSTAARPQNKRNTAA
jgi:hypothetical protein